MIKTITNSVSYRSAAAYRKTLAMLPSPRRLPDKDVLDRIFVTMCGKRHLLMLEQSLFSIALFSDSYPEIRVYSDGSLEREEILAKLAWWPGMLSVPDMGKHEDWARKNSWLSLLNYSQINGFGRKLLVIAAEAEINPFVWFDTDILFFADVSGFLSKEIDKDVVISAALDWCYGYDCSLTNGPLSWLNQLPPVNTGFLEVSDGFFQKSCLEELVALGVPKCNGFTEQTILASVVHQSGRIKWDLSDIDISDDDKQSLAPTFLQKKVPARHYVTPIRHLFWRDAVALRLGFRPLGKKEILH